MPVAATTSSENVELSDGIGRLRLVDIFNDVLWVALGTVEDHKDWRINRPVDARVEAASELVRRVQRRRRAVVTAADGRPADQHASKEHGVVGVMVWAVLRRCQRRMVASGADVNRGRSTAGSRQHRQHAVCHGRRHEQWLVQRRGRKRRRWSVWQHAADVVRLHVGINGLRYVAGNSRTPGTRAVLPPDASRRCQWRLRRGGVRHGRYAKHRRYQRRHVRDGWHTGRRPKLGREQTSHRLVRWLDVYLRGNDGFRLMGRRSRRQVGKV